MELILVKHEFSFLKNVRLLFRELLLKILQKKESSVYPGKYYRLDSIKVAFFFLTKWRK